MALVAWDKISKPELQGGLGILNITDHNKALLMKNLHKFFNRDDLPWVNLIWEVHYSSPLPQEKKVGSFWWKTHLNLLQTYKQSCLCIANSGSTIQFWSDKWSGEPLQQRFPELHSFFKTEKVKRILSVKSWLLCSPENISTFRLVLQAR